MTAQEPSRAHLAPTRRSVVRAAAWSVPAISIAASAPAFAASPDAGGGAAPQDLVTATSTLFWRPKGTEIPAAETVYWPLIPEETVIWITQVTNPGTTVVENVQLDLSVPPDSNNDEFTVLDAGDFAVMPAKFATTNRPANGRIIITLPQLPSSETATITVALERPASVARLSTTSWSLTVTPPAGGTTTLVPIKTYAEVLASV